MKRRLKRRLKTKHTDYLFKVERIEMLRYFRIANYHIQWHIKYFTTIFSLKKEKKTPGPICKGPTLPNVYYWNWDVSNISVHHYLCHQIQQVNHTYFKPVYTKATTILTRAALWNLWGSLRKIYPPKIHANNMLNLFTKELRGIWSKYIYVFTSY